MVRSKKMNSTQTFNIKMDNTHIYSFVLLIIFFMMLVLFKEKIGLNNLFEKIFIFITLYLLVLLITKNYLHALIGGILLFLIVNLMINNKNYIESFENPPDSKSISDLAGGLSKLLNEKEGGQDSLKNIQELLKKVNGGIELKDDDKVDTPALGVDTVEKYSNDKIPNALKDAQKETYALIDTVSSLTDTLKTLSPVLSEGKKIMSMFESLKLN
jgi:hypothetical protein